MTSGEPIIIVEKNARTLKKNVRRYLVGREQHDDAHFWPLISRVRIHGNFPVLANGVVLVDLPGLNDPNPAREQVTKRYLNDARYLWLICNSQTGIDKVFTQLLRDNALLYKLYMEGRLDAFSVVTTRIDDINLAAILEQMGIDPDDFDGNHRVPLNYRRQQITEHVQRNLLEIAQDIASRAHHASVREEFFRRVKAIPVFPISANAYLHATGRMPLYRGMPLTPEEANLPQLISYLNTITQEQSYRTQIDASYRRLKLLHEQVNSFFLNLIRSVELDSAAARQEWELLSKAGAQAVTEGQAGLRELHVRYETSLTERCASFEDRLKELQTRASSALSAVFRNWNGIHWRSLQAAVRRGGEWYSSSTGREFNFSRDVARAYLDQIPFVWEEFFGTHLSNLINDVSQGTQAELHKTAERIKGAMDMIQHRPPGVRESIEASLRTAGESFALQSGQVEADLTAQIQRTRQALSNGMVETAANFMQPAYDEAAADPGGTGIKGRMLQKLTQYASQHGPSLFINMRQELAEGVTVLQGAMKPQLAKLIAYGEGMLQRFGLNTGNLEVVTPEVKGQIEQALIRFPHSPNGHNSFSQSQIDPTIEKLTALEATVNYDQSPPFGTDSFVFVSRPSPVLISAPHGARAFRKTHEGDWHEEDEYTAGIALLLAEECSASVIANVWRCDEGDPNFDSTECRYKQQLRRAVSENHVRWVIDLHGAAMDSKPMGTSLVAVGTRGEDASLPPSHRDKLVGFVESALGVGTVSTTAWPASGAGTITTFCQKQLRIHAVQIEMKPCVRVAKRRKHATAFSKSGPYAAEIKNLLAMLGALKAFIEHLKSAASDNSFQRTTASSHVARAQHG